MEENENIILNEEENTIPPVEEEEVLPPIEEGEEPSEGLGEPSEETGNEVDPTEPIDPEEPVETPEEPTEPEFTEEEIVYGTTFYEVYCRFLGKITDDLYMEMTLEETFETLEDILVDSMSEFNFPRFRIFNYNKDVVTLTETKLNEETQEEETTVVSKGAWLDKLTHEEIDILAELMLVEWFNRQLATIRIVQMKYSTSDFKMTSQAAHMQRLLAVIREKERETKNQQFMYKRRRVDDEGYVVPNYEGLSGGEKIFKQTWNSLTVLGAMNNDDKV